MVGNLGWLEGLQEEGENQGLVPPRVVATARGNAGVAGAHFGPQQQRAVLAGADRTRSLATHFGSW